jgi:hypothetical protein
MQSVKPKHVQAPGHDGATVTTTRVGGKQCAKSQLRATVLAALALCITNADAQTTPAKVGDAVDELKRVMLLKYDDDIEKTATGFADAKNIHNSARWADWFRAPLDISLAVFDAD